MKRGNVSLLTILPFVGCLALAISPSAGAQGAHKYDPGTEVRVKGTIEEVQQLTRGLRCCAGTHLLLKIDSEILDVHVGPSAFVEQSQFSFAKGDGVEVLGSKVELAGKKTILAREINKEGKTLVLRDAQGIPMWSHGRR